MNKFAKRLKELREERNLYQKDLAKILGYSQAGIAKWETGDREPSLDDLMRIADYFGVMTDYLLGRED